MPVGVTLDTASRFAVPLPIVGGSPRLPQEGKRVTWAEGHREATAFRTVRLNHVPPED